MPRTVPGHGFDVFLSYGRADEAIVARLAERLRAHGLEPFLDRWYLHPDRSWQAELERRLVETRAVAVCLGSESTGCWQQREKELALARHGADPAFAVIPVLLPGATDPALGFLGLNTWVDLRAGPDDGRGLEILARAIQGLPPGPPGTRPPDPRLAVCPYRGLLPFREEDAAFFFGRRAFTRRLVDSVAPHRLVAVVGASGSGKSSVVRAGLAPTLRKAAAGGAWEVLALTPKEQPLQELAGALDPPPPELGRGDRLDRNRRAVDQLWAHGLRAYALEILKEQPGTRRLLLIVDQLE